MSGRGPGLMGHRRICIPQGKKVWPCKRCLHGRVGCIVYLRMGRGPPSSGILARDAYSGHIKSLLSGKFLCRRCGRV